MLYKIPNPKFQIPKPGDLRKDQLESGIWKFGIFFIYRSSVVLNVKVHHPVKLSGSDRSLDVDTGIRVDHYTFCTGLAERASSDIVEYLGPVVVFARS
jgi:hypothetical protein